MRLIDADALINECDSLIQVNATPNRYIDLIKNAPTVKPESCRECPFVAYEEKRITNSDARASKERPKGEWLFSINHMTHEYPWGMYKCSKCGNWEGKKTDICPNCSADMQKGGTE